MPVWLWELNFCPVLFYYLCVPQCFFSCQHGSPMPNIKAFLSSLFPWPSVTVLFPEASTRNVVPHTQKGKITPGVGSPWASLTQMTLARVFCRGGCLAGRKGQGQQMSISCVSHWVSCRKLPGWTQRQVILCWYSFPHKMTLRFVKVKLPVFPRFCFGCPERPSNCETWSLLSHFWATCSQRGSVFRLAFITSAKQAVVGLACHGWNTSSGNHLPYRCILLLGWYLVID